MKRIVDDESRTISSLIKKHGKVKIDLPNEIVGEAIITSYRKYNTNSCFLHSSTPQYLFFTHKISVTFKGQLYSNRGNSYTAKDIKKLAKIRAFRLIRKRIFSKVNSRLELFGQKIVFPADIDKLKWVE